MSDQDIYITEESIRMGYGSISLRKGKVKKGRPLVLLIHGFPQGCFRTPQLSSAWTFHIDRLSESGYRVVAPDMRGYGNSDCPLDPASYTVFHLVGDLIGLLDNLGEKQVHPFGKDEEWIDWEDE